MPLIVLLIRVQYIHSRWLNRSPVVIKVCSPTFIVQGSAHVRLLYYVIYCRNLRCLHLSFCVDAFREIEKNYRCLTASKINLSVRFHNWLLMIAKGHNDELNEQTHVHVSITLQLQWYMFSPFEKSGVQCDQIRTKTKKKTKHE